MKRSQQRFSSTWHRPSGYTHWRRFVGLLFPALIVVSLMIMGVLQGTLPVSAAMQGQQRIKLSIDRFSAYSYGSFPQFFQTRDGQRHTVVVVGLRDLRAEGMCASGKVDTPLGPFVIRINTRPGGRPFHAADVQMAVEEVNGADVAGQSLSLNRAATLPDGTPTEAGPPGTLPINAKTLTLSLHANLRWVTASGLNLSGVDLLAPGLHAKECF